MLIVAAAIQLAPLAGPLILSRDALAYWAYGRVSSVHDVSPYSVAPATFPGDPATRAMAGGWRDRTSVYGPLFTLATEGEADVTGAYAGDAATFYKIAGAVGMLTITLLVAFLSAQPALAAAATGWNPLFALQFAGGGHNDVWMIALVLGALALERRGLRQVAGFVWVCAAGIKWIPLLLLPLHALRPRTRVGWAGVVAGASTLMLVAWLRYGASWLGAFLPLAHDVGAGTRDGLLRLFGAPPTVAVSVGATAFVGALVLLVRRARTDRPVLGRTAIALLVFTPWLLPWYLVWALPLASAENDRRAINTTLALTGYLLIVHTVP